MSQLFKNNARTRLAVNLGLSSTSFSVTAGEGSLFPTLPLGDDHMLITLENSTGQKEIVKVVERAADTFVIGDFASGISTESILGRGQEGTIASAFEAQDLVELRLTAGFIDALKEGSIVYVIDGGGNAITTSGLNGWIEAPFNGTVRAARLFADEAGSGTLEVKIYKSTYADYPFTVGVDEAELISNGLLITTGCKEEYLNLTSTGANWSQRNFLKGDIFVFKVSSNNGNFSRLTISLTVDRY